MRLFFLLLRSSWRVALLAGLMGGASGAASVALLAIIHRTLRDPNSHSALLVGSFIGLCATIFLTRVASRILLTRLAQNSISQVLMGLCRRILDSPLSRLEEIGPHRMLASLTDDVMMIAQAMNGVPVVCVNAVILFFGAIYLGMLSPGLLVCAIGICALGVASYWYTARWARRYIRRGRELRDTLLKHLQSMIEGVKELKIHHHRRREFVDQVLESANADVRKNQFIGFSLQGVAVVWGRLMFFVAIGLLLFLWPRIRHVDTPTLMGYTLTILYLMSPLEGIMAYLPLMGRATVSVQKIKRLGLMLDEREPETATVTPIHAWEHLELVGVTHTYRGERGERDFLLGPIDLSLRPGETVFVIGGNGSGKTTLAKLVTGLYVPQDGEIRLDGQPVTVNNRESYRQLFSAVFDDAVIFDSLLGLGAADLDARAQQYLRQLRLDHVVSVEDGVFSTTTLSRGQRKRLALLTAYLEDRPIYLFDEWAADQDPLFKDVFYGYLLPELKRRGKAVLAITHDDRYFNVADRVIKLDEGKTVPHSQQDAPNEALIGKR
ncbi:MAG: cyclic peptide export ABC transporter [Pirellulaceae bacterium]